MARLTLDAGDMELDIRLDIRLRGDALWSLIAFLQFLQGNNMKPRMIDMMTMSSRIRPCSDEVDHRYARKTPAAAAYANIFEYI